MKDKNKSLDRFCMKAICILICSAIIINDGSSFGMWSIGRLNNLISTLALDTIGESDATRPETITCNEDNTNITYVKITNSAELLWLAQQPAKEYQNANIQIKGDEQAFAPIENFPGLGSPDYHFSGSLDFIDQSVLYLYSNHALFNWIKDSVLINNGDPDNKATITIRRVYASDATASALLAENVVHDSDYTDRTLFNNLYFIIGANNDKTNETEKDSDFGGVIGTIGSNCHVSLDVENNSNSQVAKDSDVGLACCVLGENSQLSFTYKTNSNTVNDYSTTSTGGNAGGLVGTMHSESTLTVNNDFSYTGSVTAAGSAGGLIGVMESGTTDHATTVTISNGNTEYSGTISATESAGGLVGIMENKTLLNVTGSYTFSGTIKTAANSGGLIGSSADESLTISGKTTINGNVKGTNAGGLIGYAQYSSNRTIDASNTETTGLSVSGVSLSGTNCGGLFGELYNSGTNTKTEIKNGSVTSDISADSGVYGGLIGKYDADSLGQELAINTITVTSDSNANKLTSFGGLIGEINGGTIGAYVNLSGTVTSNTRNSESNITNYGGAVADAGDNGNFIDITSGTIRITTDTAGYNGAASGGLVGTMTSGVLRLNGSVNLSEAKPAGNGNGNGLVMGYRANTLVYADSGFSITRHSDSGYRDDIGQWGEIVRHSAVEDEKEDEDDEDKTILYSSSSHTVTIKKHTTLTTVSKKEDFARLALYIQLNTEGNKGALQFDDESLTSASLLGGNITLSGNASLAGTGITGLTRDDGSNNLFTGTIDGGECSVSLAVGDESSGFRGKIYTHSHCGLIARTGDGAEIKNLTIEGYMNVFSSSVINIDDDKTTGYGARIGGLIAQHKGEGTDDDASLKISNVKALHNINIYGHENGHNRVGGLIGDSVGGRIDFGDDDNPCIIGCQIKTKSDYMTTTTCAVGGLICQSDGSVININNVQLSDTTKEFQMYITTDSSGNVGGFLGYEWLNTNTFINKLVIGVSGKQAHFKHTGATVNMGGLIKRATGYIQLKSLDFANAKIEETSSNPTSFGMLINDGKELYLEVTDNNYYGIKGLNCSVKTPTVYDEFVAYTNKTTISSNGNGIVSLPTKDRAGIDATGSNIYTNRYNNNTYKTKLNSNTRYYYNIDTIRQKESPDCGEQLLLWSLYHYALSDAWKEMFSAHLDDDFKDNKIHGNCNLTGLSYYPINIPKNTTVSIIDKTSITFDSKAIRFNNNNDAIVNSTQICMMQRSLFITMDSSSKEDIRALNIEGATITLSGAISRMSNASGALFCGTVKGSKSATDTSPNSANIKSNANTSITLRDLYVRGYNGTDVSPLLINKAEGYIDINIVGVKTDPTKEAYGLPSGQNYAASSLIGTVGGTAMESVNISFSKISLDARKTASSPSGLDGFYGTTKSIFSHATLLENFSFKPESGSTGSYDFEIGEDWTNKESPFTAKHNVTYGYEISHSVEYPKQEYWYLKNKYAVSPDTEHIKEGETGLYDFTSTLYFPYVCQSPATDTNNEYITDKNYHELKVNVAATNFTGGCGTYGDPYRITLRDSEGEQLVGADQLVTLSNILENKSFNAGYEIGFKKTTTSDGKTFTNPDCIKDNNTLQHDIYRYSGGAFYKVKSNGEIDTRDYVSKIDMFNHVRDAYYIIEDDIELESDFKGIGANEAYQIFRGVIVGKKKDDDSYPTITMKGKNPLIKISGGCVVKNLNIKYDTDIEINETTGGIFKPTQVQGITIGCDYFGGIIGQVLAGDNIIDNVNVTFGNNKKITLTGSKNYLVPVGTYVGVVRNGGLIFRNMAGKNTISCSDMVIYKNETETYDFSDMTDTNYLYINPYVGRVLDGYVITEDKNSENKNYFGDSALNNTDKNYSIVNLDKTTSNNEKLSLTLLSKDLGDEYENVLSGLPKNSNGKGDTDVGNFTWSNIQLPNAESLFILSAMVSSGAAAYQPNNGSSTSRNPKANTNFHYFTDTSYFIGSTHLANYDNIQNLSSTTDSDFVISKTDVRGKYDFKEKASEEYAESKSIPYIVKNYTVPQETKNGLDNHDVILDNYPSRIICSSNSRYSITLTHKESENTGSTETEKYVYEMPKGFRGINAMYNNTSYSTNPDRQVINMFGFNGNGYEVNMNMKIMSYGNNDAYNPFGVGLVTRFQQNTSGEIAITTPLKSNDFSSYKTEAQKATLKKYKDTYAVENLIISGELSYDVPAQNGERATEEFVRKNGSSIIDRQSVNVGGFAGRNYDSYSKTLYYWFDNVKVSAKMSGGYSTGGLIGAIGDFENNTKGFDGKGATGSGSIGSANVQTVVANNISSDGIEISSQKYAGGLFGIVKKSSSGIFVDCSTTKQDNPFKIKSIVASMNENRCGGLIGNTTTEVGVKNTAITNMSSGINGIVGNPAEDTFEAAVYAGGIVGYLSGTATIKASSVSNLNVNVRSAVDECSAGGMVGHSNNASNFSECVLDACSVYIKSNGVSSNVGGLCGKLNANSTIEHCIVQNSKIKTDPTIGANKSYRIGGLIGHINGKNISGFNLLLYNNTFDAEKATTYGNWIGRADIGLIKLTAISKQGTKDYLALDLGGSASNLNSNNALIYADYDGTALDETNRNTTNAKSPYIYVNPKSDLFDGLPKMGDNENDEVYTGNGVSFGTDEGYTSYPIAKQIIDKATDNTIDNSDYINITTVVNGVKKLNLGSEFTFDGTNANVITFNKQLENDKDKLTYPEIRAEKDFPVLVIQNSDTESLNQFFKDYLSVLTNEKNLNIDALAVQTYQLQKNSKKAIVWTKTNIKNSLKVVDNKLYSVPGQYDNEKAQFTMIKVTFNSPVSSSDKLNLYVPVIAKKVLQFKVDTRVISETKYLESLYQKGDVIENNGVPITSLITFTYCDRTYQEWVDLINVGEDYFWNFDKSIMLKHNDNQNPLYKEDATDEDPPKITLVDKNNINKAYFGKLSDTGLYDYEHLGKLDFSKLKDDPTSGTSSEFKPVTIAELLCKQMQLEAVSAAEGSLVETTEDGTGSDKPTIMAYLNDEISYFRLYNDDDAKLESQPPRYNISVGLEEYKASDKVDITEQYYLTVQTDERINKLFYITVEYSYSSLEGGNIATHKYSENNDSFVLGNFFRQDNYKIQTTNGDTEITDANNTIKTELSVDIIFVEENRRAYDAYSDKLFLYQGFILSYVESIKNNRTPKTMLSDTKISGTYTITAGDEAVLGKVEEHISESCSQVLIKCPDKDINGDDINLKNIVSGSNTITLKADLDIDFSGFTDSQYVFQFPSRKNDNSGDEDGLVVCGKSNISYEEAKLLNSIVSTGSSKADGYGYENASAKLYYIIKSTNATLAYDAVSEYLGDSYEKISQLGINANELKQNTSHINARGIYDASMLETESSADGMIFEFTLERKSDDSNSYNVIPVLKYIENFKLKIGDATYDTGTLTDNKYIFDDISWASASKGTGTVTFNTSFDVKTKFADTDTDTETYFYSNYKLKLTVRLKNEKGPIDNSNGDDYIVYTNCRIFTDIVE